MKKDHVIAAGIIIVIGVLLWMYVKTTTKKPVTVADVADGAMVSTSGDPTASYGNQYIVVPPTIPPYNPIIANLTGVPGTPYGWEYQPPPESNPLAYVPATKENLEIGNAMFTAPTAHSSGACCDECANDKPCSSGAVFPDGSGCMSATRQTQPGFDRPIYWPNIGGMGDASPATLESRLMTNWLWNNPNLNGVGGDGFGAGMNSVPASDYIM